MELVKVEMVLFLISNKNFNEYYYNQEYTKIKIVKENREIANTNEIGFLHISTPSILIDI